MDLTPITRWALMLCIPLSTSLQLAGADLLSVSAVHDRMLLLHFDDGRVDYHEVGEPFSNDVLEIEPLAVDSLVPTGFVVGSAGDAVFGAGLEVSALNRKSKGTEFAFRDQNWDPSFGFRPDGPYAAREHWVYLTLPEPMQAGETYTISWDATALNTAVATSELTFDVNAVRSESVHVNQLGYVPGSTAKYGYLYHWAGDGGGVDFMRFAGEPFHLVENDSGEVVFTGTIASRASADQMETGQTDTPNQNFSGAPVWECNFSAYTTPGEYRLVIPGVGTSFPFALDDDVYREAFQATLHGLLQNRSGITLNPPIVAETRPVPHNPLPVSEGGTPGFQNRLKYSTTKFYEITSDGGGDADRLAMEAGYRGELTATWGWYQDAGDWDGYIAHTDIPMQLLALYQLYPDKFRDGELNLPSELNGIPDLVDEGAWLLRFFYRQRQELLTKGWGTGGVGSRVFGDLWGSDRPEGIGRGSWEDTDRDWYVTGEDPFSTYRYAAGVAQLAEILATLGVADPAGVNWMNEAIEAYDWALANTSTEDATRDVHDPLPHHRALAAAALYRLTGEADYHERLLTDLSPVLASDSNLSRTRVVAIALYLDPRMARSRDIASAERLRGALLESARAVTIDTADRRALRWGGNFFFPLLVGHGTTPLIQTAVLSHAVLAESHPFEAAQMLEIARTTADYFLGNNPLNTTWITGLGDRYPTATFTMDDFYDGPLLRRGVTPYGPWRFADDHIAQRMPASVWWAWDTTYPSIDPRGTGQPSAGAVEPGTWPGHEAWFPNRHSPQATEFTIHQNNLPNALTYGFLSAAQPNVPQIVQLSSGRQIAVGGRIELEVEARGSGGLTYQWQREGLNLDGETAANLVLTNLQLGEGGDFRVVVTNAHGSTTSDAISIEVVSQSAADATRAVNISTRAQSGTGDALLVPGFVIQGSGTRSLLIRAVGPRLGDFGVGGYLEDPVLELIRTTGGNQTLAVADDWLTDGDASRIMEVGSTLGAFSLDGRDSGGELDARSAAMVVELGTGAYTTVCRGKEGGTGVALVEIYDIEGSAGARLVNLSNRGVVGTGNDVMVPGLVVKGPASRTFLVRAAGPALADFGVQGTLADPQLEVFNAEGDEIATNDDWNADVEELPALNEAFATVGAFAFANGSRDAAALLTLGPGVYTVVCRGADAGTGVALVEVYELP